MNIRPAYVLPLRVVIDTIRARGFEALAIPHNSNSSDGLMFGWLDSFAAYLDRAYAMQRQANEPLAEISQNKGASEAHPLLSPNDELAGIVKKSGKLYGVTYNYTGYPMIRQARQMIEQGKLLIESGWNCFRLSCADHESKTIYEPRESVSVTARWLVKAREAAEAATTGALTAFEVSGAVSNFTFDFNHSGVVSAEILRRSAAFKNAPRHKCKKRQPCQSHKRAPTTLCFTLCQVIACQLLKCRALPIHRLGRCCKRLGLLCGRGPRRHPVRFAPPHGPQGR